MAVMKKLLLIVIVLLVLAGGGGAAWWFLLREPPAEGAADAAPAPTRPAFVALDKMAVPVIRADGSIRTFIVELSLELSSEAALGPVNEVLPRIYDQLLVTLSELLGRRFVEDSGYDQTIIKQHLLRVARQAAGGDLVSAVLIINLDEFKRG